MAGNKSIVSIVVKLKDETQKGIKGLWGRISGLQGAIVGLFAGVITTALFRLGTTAEETASKFNTVFGESAKTLDVLAQNWGRFAGLTKTSARDLLATTGAVAQGFGMMQEQSAAFSETVIRLSGDLASFHNKDIKDVNHAIVSALAGEREALKSLGIVVTENDVQTEALRQTRKKSIKEITSEDKAYATLAVIQARAGVAVGDLERTQDSLANRTRRLRADVGNLADKLATALLPTFEQLIIFAQNNIGVIESVVNGFVAGAEWSVKFAGGIALLVEDVKVLIADLNILRLRLRDFFGAEASWSKDLREGLGRVGVKMPGTRGLDLSGSPFGGFQKFFSSTPDEEEWVDAFSGRRRAVENRDAKIASIFGLDTGVGSEGVFASLFGGPGSSKGGGSKAYGVGGGEADAEAARKALLERMDRLFASAAKSDASRAGGTLAERELRNMFVKSERVWLDNAQKWVDAASLEAIPTTLAPLHDGKGGLGALGGGFAEELLRVSEAMGAFEELDSLVNGSLLTGFSALGDAVSGAMTAWITGAQSAGEAFTGAMLGALASVAKAFGDFYMAKAVAAVGEMLLGHPGAGAAAAKYAGAAALMYAVAGVATAGAYGGTGGARGGLTRDEFATRDDVLDSRGSATLIVEGGFLDMTDPRQADAFAKAIGDLTGRRVTVVGGRG